MSREWGVRRWCLAATCLILWSPGVWALHVVVLVPNERDYYQDFVSGVDEKLGLLLDEPLDLDVVRLGGDVPTLGDGDYLIAAGTQATQYVLAMSPRPSKVIYSLLPEASYNTLKDDGAIFDGPVLLIDQPLERYVALACQLAPGTSCRLGLLYASEYQATYAQLESLAKAMSFELLSQEVKEQGEISRALESVLQGSDVLLALPQEQIYNRNTIRSILLASYRARKPLVMFAKSYVKAGAVAAVFSTPEQMGQQVAEYVVCLRDDCQRLVHSQKHYPNNFAVSVNRHVARLLEISVPGDQLLRQHIQVVTGSYE